MIKGKKMANICLVTLYLYRHEQNGRHAATCNHVRAVIVQLRHDAFVRVQIFFCHSIY